MQPSYDIAIVGAGMVGATLANALAPAGLRIALLEARLPEPADGRGDWDLRVSAVNRASQQVLREAGAWTGICDRRLSPFRRMFVWEEQAHIEFDAAEIGEPLLGHIIENRVIQTALLERIGHQDSIELIHPARLAGLDFEPDRVRLRLEGGQRLSARLVVGADGAQSRVRALGGIPIGLRDYHQQGLVATVRTALPNRATAWQRFTPEGPLAFLPLNDGRCSIVWSQPTEQARRRLALDTPAFLAELRKAWGTRLGEILEAGPRAAFPLIRRRASAYVRPRLALVGDAAHTIHPLAGQGVNLGLMDAAALAELLLDAISRSRDPGGLSTLRRYERRRRGDNDRMQSAMDAFYDLFGTAEGPLVTLRRLGLQLADRTPPLKTLFMHHAMGRRGGRPKPGYPPA